MSDPRKPRVFRLDMPENDKAEQDRTRAASSNPDVSPRKPSRAVVLAEEPDAFALETAPQTRAETVLKPSENPFSFWSKLFWSALTGLLSLALGLWFWRLVDELFRTSAMAGWLGVVLLSLVMLALIVLMAREVRGVMRLTSVSQMREDAEKAFETDDGVLAKSAIRRLMAFQNIDPTTAAQRTVMQDYLGEIIDGRGLLVLADKTLLHSRDEKAKALIAAAAKRVSVVTAISPRALVDVLFVGAQSIMLTRRIAEVYGTRPGNLGFLRLARKILGHLAITGGVAITDSVFSQLVGHGLAARLSAKLGEGVLNGLLTARVGLACIAACRPLPFLASDEPKLQDVAGEIISNPLGKND